MRTLGACLLTAVLVALIAPSMTRAVDVQGRTQAQLALRSSVVLGKSRSDTGCGGTFIARTVVITASHCLGVYDRIKVYDYAGGEYEITSIARNRDRDLVLLALNRPTSMPVALLGTEIGVGEQIRMVGSPPGLSAFSLSTGWVSLVAMYQFEALNGVEGGILQEYLQLDVRGFYGNSGGGVFNDEGRLIGVQVRALVMRDTEAYQGQFILWMFAVGPGALKTFLQEAGR